MESSAGRTSRYFGNRDPRELAAYGVTEAAHYLQLPVSTVRSWVVGQYYTSRTGKRRFERVIIPPAKKYESQPVMSFINLVEAHVLAALRRDHHVRLDKVRRAIDFLERNFPEYKHPLVDLDLLTDGINVFVEQTGLVNVTRSGQMAVKELLLAHLKRIERDRVGLPLKLYPFTTKHQLNGSKVIAIDPFISFGRPVIAGTGITTATIAERFDAGESIEELASDYSLDDSQIQEAIRYERQTAAA